MTKRRIVFLIGILLCFFLVGCNASDGQGDDPMFVGEWLGYNTDGDGDPIAKRLTLSAGGIAEYLIQHLLMGESF